MTPLSLADASVVRNVTSGSQFRLFVQNRKLPGFEQPELVTVSAPGGIGPGPEDYRMYVVDAIDKLPYGQGGGQPPYRGHRNPAVKPDTNGNFAHIDPDSREFASTTMYATVCRVLNVWEGYLKKRIKWTSGAEKLELIPIVNVDNAFAGDGYIEFGSDREGQYYSLNFDVLAHEVGHQIIFDVVGFPSDRPDQYEFGGFHESCGDLVAMIAALHFNTMVENVLAATWGNLYSHNELGRLGEITKIDQIRNASNIYTMFDYPGFPRKEEHGLSEPLTGAIFDILVEVYQRKLVKLGAISPALAERSFHANEGLEAEFKAAFQARPAAFKQALIDARDYLGDLLAACWSSLQADNFSYTYYGRKLIEADQQVSQGVYRDIILKCIRWRKIQVPLSRDTLHRELCLAPSYQKAAGFGNVH